MDQVEAVATRLASVLGLFLTRNASSGVDNLNLWRLNKGLFNSIFSEA